MRESIGEVLCPFHRRRRRSEIRRDKNGKLYYYCEACGPVTVHGRTFQEWLLQHGVIIPQEKTAS